MRDTWRFTDNFKESIKSILIILEQNIFNKTDKYVNSGRLMLLISRFLWVFLVYNT